MWQLRRYTHKSLRAQPLSSVRRSVLYDQRLCGKKTPPVFYWFVSNSAYRCSVAVGGWMRERRTCSTLRLHPGASNLFQASWLTLISVTVYLTRRKLLFGFQQESQLPLVEGRILTAPFFKVDLLCFLKQISISLWAKQNMFITHLTKNHS